MRLSESTKKIWMKIDPQYQRQRCSPMTLDSANIRFMRIFAGVPWKGGVIQQWGNRKRVLSGFRTLRIRHLRKWGQHYYIVLFSPLSPFHWPQNTWPWMTLNGLNGHFTLYVHYYELPLVTYLMSFVYYTCDQRMWPAANAGCGVVNSDPQNVLESAENLRILRGRYIVGTLANNTNIIIQYYLVRYRLSTDSKTRDFEWPWIAILC